MARRVVRLTKAMEQQALAAMDWAAIDAMTDADIARQVRGNPDAAPILSAREHAAAMVRAVRAKLDLTQAEFARRFAIPVGTLRDWEQGRRVPEAGSMAYLKVIEREPGVVERVVRPGP